MVEESLCRPLSLKQMSRHLNLIDLDGVRKHAMYAVSVNTNRHQVAAST